MRALALSLLCVLACPALARADVLSPPPTDCAPGMIGVAARGGGHCAETRCDDATPCPSEPFCPSAWQSPCAAPEPWSCSEEELGLCVQTFTRPVVFHSAEGPITEQEIVEVALGACGPEGTCASAEARCVRARRCLHAPAPPPSAAAAAAAADAGCAGCAVDRRADVSAHGRLAVLGLAIGIALAARARHSRRARGTAP